MKTIETRLAALETIAKDLNVVRFKPSVKIDQPGVMEIFNAAGNLVNADRISVLAIIPEDADFDIAVMRADLGQDRGSHRIKVMAVVCESTMFQCITELYLRYYPQRFPVQVFTQMEEALIWLEEHPEHRAVA